MRKYGQNVTKLIIRFMAREAIPLGGGLASGIEFFRNTEHRKQVLAKAEANTLEALRVFKTAPDNPFGDDDEAIAEAILMKIEEKLNKDKSITESLKI